MHKVKIVTDSNSGITQAEAEKPELSVLPMPFLIDGKEYFEDVTLSQQEFYTRLKQNAEVSTSQPAPASLAALWDKLLETCDEIVHIPMSSALSQSCQSAAALARQYGGRVVVVDNRRISVTQKQSVYDALTLAKRGLTATEIKAALEENAANSSIYISLDTLRYLKKGGRLTPAAALIGTILKIKPVLQIRGDKLDAFKKAPTLKKAKSCMLEAVAHDFETDFSAFVKAGEMRLAVAYSDDAEEGAAFLEEIKSAFPTVPVLYCDPLSLSISCHIGPGALAIATFRVEQ